MLVTKQNNNKFNYYENCNYFNREQSPGNSWQPFWTLFLFFIYDATSGSIEFIPNPNREALEGAGPASIQLVASKGVEKVVSGEFGAKVKAIFDSLKIQLIIVKDRTMTIDRIIEMVSKQ